MRNGLPAVMAAWIVLAMWHPARARAQSDTVELPVLLLHWRVSTSLQLPDEITEVRLLHREELKYLILDDMLHIRPRQGIPAGTEALLVVESRTLRRTFLVRVAQHPRDADVEVLVLPLDAQPRIALVTPLAPPVVPAPPVAPVCISTSGSVLVATAAESAAPAGQASTIAADTERDTTAARSRGFDLSVQALVAVGTTALHVAGYQSINARQSHHAIGGRVAIHPRGTPWAVEGSISGERLVAPTTHNPANDSVDNVLAVGGPRLRADVSLSGRFGRTLMPTFRVGLGLQAHHLDIEAREEPRIDERRSDLPFEGVLALGMGLEYRTGDVLLGLELHVRQGVLTGYRSVSGILSVGFFLDQGD